MTRETYFAFILLICCAITSGLSWIGCSSTYRQLHDAELQNNQEQHINQIIIMKRLESCAVSFGTYVATKGKYGREYFEQHR